MSQQHGLKFVSIDAHFHLFQYSTLGSSNFKDTESSILVITGKTITFC